MWILPLIGYAGVILGFAFLTLAIASGLYYLSELVEEYTVLSKKILTRLIYTVIVLQVLLCIIDRFPVGLSLLSVISHVVYMQNLRRFPVVKLTDPFFLLSCALVLTNHLLWFRHFQKPPSSRLHHIRTTTASSSNNNNDPGSYRYNPYDPVTAASLPSFNEIASYFGLCVWLVPFSLFIALSAGENVLPSMGSEYATGEGSSFTTPGFEPGSSTSSNKIGGGIAGSTRGAGGAAGLPQREGMAKAVVNGVRDAFKNASETVGWAKPQARRRFD